MAASPDPDTLLGALMSPDNAVRRNAEATWEDMKRQVPDEVLELMCRVLGRRDVGSEGLRAMAAVLLRTLFDFRSDLWRRVQPPTKTAVKNALVARLTEEPVAHVRRKLTHAIGQLAGVSASESEWPEVMALTVALCSPDQRSPEFKVVGLDLVNILAEFCPQSLAPHEAGLLQMFDACLGDADAGIRVAALKACCSFLQDLDGVVPPPTQGQATVTAEDEDAARDVLEALNVVAAKQPGFLVGATGDALGFVGEALLSLAASPALEVSTRELSLEFITTVFESVPSGVREKGASVVQALVPLTIHMLAQPPEDGGGDDDLAEWLSKADEKDDGDDDDDLAMVAASVLSRIAIALGGQHVLSSALPVCSEFLGDASNWRRRKAGLLTLLLIGEGCGEDMASNGLLPQIVLGPVASGVADADPRVRQAGLACLSQMAEDFGDWDGSEGGDGKGQESEGEGSFQGKFHAQILPLLVQSLGGPNANIPRLQATAASALITFCNPARMRAEWLYAPAGDLGIIGKVMLESLRDLARDSPSVAAREEALTAAGCVAQVLGPGFGFFYDEFLPLAKEILTSTPPTENPNTDTLRGKAMEAIALIGAAVGVERFRADAHQVIKVLILEQKTFSRDPSNPQSTYTLNSLARMAGVLGPEFLPYLDDAVKPLLQGLSLDAEIKVSSASSAATAREQLEEAGLTPLEMDVRGLGRQLFGVNTSLMQAKESACRALFQYTDDLGEGFAAHARETLLAVLPNLGPRNAVAVQVVSAAIVPRLVGMVSRRASDFLTGEAQTILDLSIRSLCEVISRIDGDGGAESGRADDMEPVCIAVDSLSTLLEKHCMPKMPSSVSVSPAAQTMAVTVLRDAARASMRRSQARAAADAMAGAGAHGAGKVLAGLTGAVDSAEREEQDAWEEDLLTSSGDGIGWIVKVRRESFLPTFESMLKPLVLPLLQPQPEPSHLALSPVPVPPSQQSFALCLCIDVLEHCGDGGRRSIFGALLPALLWGCSDGAPASTRQACAYGLGVAADHGGQEFDAFSAEAFRLLMGLVEQGRRAATESDEEHEEDISGVTDNAVSAALRVLFSRLDPVVASLAPGGKGEKSAAAAPAVKALLGMLPLTSDLVEAKDCHRRIVGLVCSRKPVLLGGGVHVPELVRVLAGMMAYQPSDEEMATVTCGGGGCCAKCVWERSDEDPFWERQLVDRDTREVAESAVEALRAAFPQAFEEAWASLGENMRKALTTPTSSVRMPGA